MSNKARENIEKLKRELDSGRITLAIVKDIISSAQESPEDTGEIISSIDRIINDTQYETVKIYFYSVFLQLPFCLYKNDCIQDIISLAEISSELSVENLYFIYQQLNSSVFCNKELQTYENQVALIGFYKKIVAIFRRKLTFLDDMSYIPIQERNKDLYIVVTSQILSVEHAPTKLAYDYCKALIENGKSVLLISTSDCCTQVGEINLHHSWSGKFVYELENINSINYQGVNIPYFQAPHNMPDVGEMQVIMNCIYESKPERVISIGGGNITAELCNQFIPVLVINMGAGITATGASFLTYGRDLTDRDHNIIAETGFGEERLIRMHGQFTINNNGEHISKEALGMGQDSRFQAVVVGNRLDREINGDFVEMIRSLPEDQICINFVGLYENYQTVIENDDKLVKMCRLLGYQRNLLGLMECMDLFVNPIRIGGGTSALFALYNGVPVVTTRYGDIYANCGADFGVEDYKEMSDTIRKYMTDKAYYKSQSEKALVQASKMTGKNDDELLRVLAVCDERENNK